MVTDSHDDGEGELLARIRDLTGPELPVVVSLDLHANLTQKMVDHASAMTIFRTYPHLDMAETGGAGPAAIEASHFRRKRLCGMATTALSVALAGTIYRRRPDQSPL